MGYVYWLAILLAQNGNGRNGAGDGGAGGNGPQRPPGDLCGGNMLTMLPMFILLALLFYFMMIRPQQREQRRRQELLSRIKKNDRVVTIGGIKGVVTNVQDDEVTIRVDDTTNAKLRMLRSSISQVLGEEEPGGDKD